MRWFVYGVLALGTLSILFGFLAAGSPFAERMRRFDERRIQNLQTLQYEIVNFWQAKEKLPPTIDALRDDIRGFIPPKDPETEEPYEYKITGARQFELCATFKTSNKEDSVLPLRKTAPAFPEGQYPVSVYEESWLYHPGETCFSRTIDPDRFPPFKR